MWEWSQWELNVIDDSFFYVYLYPLKKIQKLDANVLTVGKSYTILAIILVSRE